MNVLANLIMRHRPLAGGVIVVWSIAALWGVSRLAFDDNYKDVFRSPDVRYRSFERLASTFGAGDGDCVVLLESADILSRPALAAILKIHNAAAEIADVESVVSLYTARRPRRVGRVFLPLFPGDEASDEQFERARLEADQNPLVRGPLLSADHRASLVLIRLRDPGRPVEAVEPILRNLRRVVTESTGGSDVHSSVTGMPAIRVETIRRLQREHVMITVAGAALATIVAWALLRRLAAVALVVIPALVGVLWTMGVLGLAGRNLNAINIVLPALVMVIGVTDSIHLMFHFREGRAAGQKPLEAAVSALRDIGGACSLTALTTAVGFLSLIVSDDQIIRDFGLFGGIGVTLTFIAVITLLPLACSTRLGWACTPRQMSHLEAHPKWPDWFFDRVAPLAMWILASGVVASAALAVVAWRIEADYSFLENLTDASESYQAMRRTEQQFGGAPLLQIMVEWPEAEELRSRKTLDVLAQVHRALERNPATSAPVSIYSLLRSLPGEGDDLFERFSELRYIRSDRLRPILHEQERLALVTAYVPDAGAAALRKPLDALDAKLREIEQNYPGYQLHLTGFAILATYRTTPMIMNLLTGISMELVVIFAVISLVLRSVTLGLLSLPSNVFPMLATAAAIVVTGLPLQYATVLAFNICLGIAVDDTVHFLSRYKHEFTVSGDRMAATRQSFRAVAPVMVTQTILMLTGFGAGLFCSIPTIRAFSACSCVALLLALASEALIVPSLLVCMARLMNWNKDAQAAQATTASKTVAEEIDVR